MRKTFYFFISTILLIATANEASTMKREFNIEGKLIKATVNSFNPSLTISSQTKSDNPVISVYLKFNLLLSQGKIKEAAQLSTSPTAEEKTLKAYADRIGQENFNKLYSELFQGKFQIKGILEDASERVLIVKHPEHGLMASPIQCKGDKCLLIEDILSSPVVNLMNVFNQIQSGKEKL